MVSYAKSKQNSMYFIEIDGVKIITHICDKLNISFEEYINTIKLCGGKFSSKWGWFLPTEEKAINCCIMLNLLMQ